ncbi:calnexin-like isoform X2 [Ceratina calcarata]|uniref:Calnexin-like isoform X2 n=1 Tax=Ceratina calcarata TaxID=156304 RepID=A0AAJ7J3X9_9HYME|nr:calnexin-like isoform X2 [Ceratina calcarata]
MARLVAKLIVYLCLICNIISGNKNADENNVVEGVKGGTVYKTAEISGFAYLVETFDDEEKFKKTWVLSEAKKDSTDDDIAKYDGIWSVEEPKKHAQDGDLGLVLKSKARHAALSTLLSEPFHFKEKPLIVQYEVNFQEGQECGGAYMKLLSLDAEHQELNQFHDRTPYTIMFGPDKCGNSHYLRFIFRHKNPLNGSMEEKHCKKPKERLEELFKDKQPHLYTLIVRPDNSFEIKIDNKLVNSGSLLDDFDPPVNPPLEIEDPNDAQPDDWDDREKIPDLSAVKPDDWDEDAPAQIVDEDDVMPDGWLEDEPPVIPNTDAVKPDDWDVDMDGEWEPPEIPNPKCADVPGCGPYKQKMKKNPRYKGKWSPPLINNPNFKGKWKPRLIHNPNYFNDEHPFQMTPIFAVGFELWSMSPDILFDNILVTDDERVAKKWADDTFEVRRARIAEESWSVWRQIGTFTAEHPWIWAIYIIAAGLPILLVIYCCCFASQDKYDSKDEDKHHLESNADEPTRTPKQEESENDPSSPPSPSPPPTAGTESEEEIAVEKVEETEQLIESEENDKPAMGGDGPRRRKPNKE